MFADSFESPLQHLIKCTFFSVTSQTTRICLTDIWRGSFTRQPRFDFSPLVNGA
jgi:hypothetical protein